MSTVAQQLREAREAQQLTIDKVAEITKIRTDHLRALEEGDFDVFSAPVYIRGFVRSYSALLKLNVPQVMLALDGELGQTQKFAEPPPLSTHSRGLLDFITLQFSKIDWRKGIVALSAVIVLAVGVSGYLVWRHYKSADPLAGLKPGVYQSTSKNSGDTLPVPAPGTRR
jgi:cytoskeletal protein RodZ